MKITYLEKQGILGIAESNYQSFPDGSGRVWSFSVTGDFTDAQRPGIISSLSKKELIFQAQISGEDAAVMLTKKGLSELKKIRGK